MKKYTPGPWTAHDEMIGDDVYDHTVVTAEKDRWSENGPIVICELHDRADAYLIAAAPELLEAAITAVSELRTNIALPWVDALRAAIAKAEGKK